MFKQGPKRCSQCEPILMYNGKPLTKAIVRDFKLSKKQTWNEAVQAFNFESYADYSAYFGSAVPLLSRN